MASKAALPGRAPEQSNTSAKGAKTKQPPAPTEAAAPAAPATPQPQISGLPGTKLYNDTKAASRAWSQQQAAASPVTTRQQVQEQVRLAPTRAEKIAVANQAVKSPVAPQRVQEQARVAQTPVASVVTPQAKPPVAAPVAPTSPTLAAATSAPAPAPTQAFTPPKFAGAAPAGFDGAAYLAANPDLDPSTNAWEHFVTKGIDENRPLTAPQQAAAAANVAAPQPRPPAPGMVYAADSYGGPGGQPVMMTGPGRQAYPGGYGGMQTMMQPPGQGLNVLPYDPRSYGNIQQYVNEVQDATFDQQMRNLKPQFDSAYERQVQDLANRGLPVGGEAYNKAMAELNRNRDNAYMQAANQAIMAGGQEADRRLGMEQGLRSTAWQEALGQHQTNMSDTMARMQIEQNLRNQALQEMLMGRTQAFNEASAILQGSPALQMMQAPQMAQYQLQAPDVIGAHMGAYNAQMQAYNAKAAASGSAWAGVGQMAGALGGLAAKSSKEFKHDFGSSSRLIDRLPALHIGTWRYLPEIDPRQELHIGPFAEDFRDAFGVGDGKELRGVDVFGVVMKMMQEMQDEIRVLKEQVNEPAAIRPKHGRAAAGGSDGTRADGRAPVNSAAKRSARSASPDKAAHGRKGRSKPGGGAKRANAADKRNGSGTKRNGRSGTSR